MTDPVPTQPVADPGAVGLGRLAQVSLFVRDLERAVGFYRDVLGLRHLFSAGPLAFLDIDGTRLYLHESGDDDWRPGSILYFLVEDITASYRTLQERGVKAVGAPHPVHTDEASGIREWMAFVEDPDGNTLALLARVRPEPGTVGTPAG